MREKLCIEVSRLLSDGTATKCFTPATFEHAVSGFCQGPAVVTSTRPFQSESLASRPFCAPHRNVFVTQRHDSFTTCNDDRLMKSFFGIEFCVCGDGLSPNLIVHQLWNVIKSAPARISMQNSVGNSQTSRSRNDSRFAVWFSF